jgi:hypothetical protein
MTVSPPPESGERLIGASERIAASLDFGTFFCSVLSSVRHFVLDSSVTMMYYLSHCENAQAGRS